MVNEKSSKQELLAEIQKLKERMVKLESGESSRPSTPPAKGKKAFGGNETILVVDDTDEVRGFASVLLEERGYHVLQAPNGESALEAYKNHEGPIHLILSDIVMLDLSGLEMVRKLEPLRQETQVLFMSGYNTAKVAHDDVFRVLALGANFIPKPLSSETLLHEIRRLLDRDTERL